MATCPSDEVSSDNEEEIIYPSQKLGAITRKKNEIKRLMENKTDENVKAVGDSLKKLETKVYNFKSAVESELKKNAACDIKDDLKEWAQSHLESVQLFTKEVNDWQLPKVDLNETCESDLTWLKEPDCEKEMEAKTAKRLTSEVSLNEILAKQNEITLLLAQNQSKPSWKYCEPETFDGSDPTEYRSFILSFERTVMQRTSNRSDLYYALMKFTKGEAQKLVKSCNFYDADVAYTKAREHLEKMYGNEYMAANHYLLKLEHWKPIQAEDAKSLHELSLFLTRCAALMDKVDSLNQLNSLKEISSIVKKLPPELRTRFRRLAGSKLQNNTPVVFKDLVEFVFDEAQLLQIPLLGDIVDSKSTHKERKVFLSSTTRNEKRFSKSKFCHCCKKNNHRLDDCFFFKQKSIPQREEFIRRNKICFGCLDSTQHFSSNCKHKLVCSKCSKKHPTSLHKEVVPMAAASESIEDESTDKEEDTANATMRSSSSHHANLDKNKKLRYPAVLVDVSIGKSHKKVRTYLGMDPFSSDVFINEDLVKCFDTDLQEVTLSLTTMHNCEALVTYKKVSNLEIYSVDNKTKAVISSAFAKENWPFDLADSPSPEDVENHPQLKILPINYDDEAIGVLVGINRPDIVRPLEMISTTKSGPYATRHLFGWAINGPVWNGKAEVMQRCFHTKVECDEPSLSAKFDAVFSKDFDDVSDEPMISYDDKKWINMVEKSVTRLPSGHLQIDLPFCEPDPCLPNNYNQARYRLESQKKRFINDQRYFEQYRNFMEDMLKMNYAEVVPDGECTEEGKAWYLIHFSVEHKRKKKIRIVFDCSLKFQNVCLNDVLMQGPNLTNSLVGVLLRFREGKYAFSADIKSMYYQVRVPVKDSKFLRFLWYQNHDLSTEPIEYRLMVHVFGAKSSPSCANFALKYTARTCPEESSEVKSAILNSFYVDDILRSGNDEEKVIENAHQIVSHLNNNGFELTHFVSNSRRFIREFPEEKLSKEIKCLDMSADPLPNEKALGVSWNTQNDSLMFHVEIERKAESKRGILATLFSIYDPLFLISPVLIMGKRLFQKLCELKIDWDDALPKNLLSEWRKWIYDLQMLSTYEVPRCVCNTTALSVQLHVFCDGSMTAYGAVAYIRVKDSYSNVTCSIMMAKSRLTPIGKSSLKTVPRIELNAAKMAVVLHKKIVQESTLVLTDVFFWTDSTVVLSYIKSDNGRFHRFVANRVDFIRICSHPDQWKYVPTKLNPADLLSRGSKSVHDFVQNNEWKEGPSFLYLPTKDWPGQPNHHNTPEDDIEVKNVIDVNVAQLKEPNPTEKILESTSEWFKLTCRIAAVLRVIDRLKNKSWKNGPLSVHELDNSEKAIWRYIQRTKMNGIYQRIQCNKLEKRHYLRKLNPFIDREGLLRVGGRIANADLSYNQKHPIILPRCDHVVKMCQETHRKVGHLGRETMIAELRENFHIIGCTALVKEICRQCVICRKTQARPAEQVMADLPKDRLTSGHPPFTNTGVDVFGPITVSRGRGRTTEKRYGIIFTCLSSRAMHIEVAHSLNVDSFINALRRFTSRRGPVQMFRSDNGTNFVAGNKELQNAVTSWNNKQVDDWCKAKHIDWKFNPPMAPHFGGIWEREIRTIKKTLFALSSEFTNKVLMTDDTLNTLLCEVENILNNRPLTAVSHDPNDLNALTPNHLLRLCSNVSYPPDYFAECDSYHRRRWRQIQHLADMFWYRWRREYLPLLLNRQKWLNVRRSLQHGDLVLVSDQLLPRSMWCTGRIQEVDKDKHGHVRSATVKVAKFKSGNNLKIGSTILKRPITKLILIKAVEELIN